MCLGGGSSKPALQQRTLPAEGVRPADESVKKSSGQKIAPTKGAGAMDLNPFVMASRAEKEWAEKGRIENVPGINPTKDPGINY